MIQNDYAPQTAAEKIIHAQVLCFCVEYALACMWMSWNVRPVMVIGHSLGEYAALAISRALSLRDALHLVVHRAQLMLDCCDIGSSGMLACHVPASQLETLFESSPARYTGLSIACRNAEGSSVVAGSTAGIEFLIQTLQSQGHRCQKLDVPLGFHSPALDPIQEPLRRFCTDNISISAPDIPTGSCYYGRLIKPGDLSSEYFSNQTRGTVQFTDLINSLSRSTDLRDAIFIETGPNSSTLPFVESSLPATSAERLFLPTLRRRVDPWVSICGSLQALSRVLPNDNIDWRRVWAGSDARLIDGPRYPFQQSARYIPYSGPTNCSEALLPAQSMTNHSSSFYHLRSTKNSERHPYSRRFETGIDKIETYVHGHTVGGQSLCPASLYHGMLLEAHNVDAQIAPDRQIVVQNVSFSRPLIVFAGTAKSMIVSLKLDNLSRDDGQDTASSPAVQRFTFSSSHRGDESRVTEHCSGSILQESVTQTDEYLADKAANVLKQAFYLKSQRTTHNVFQTHMIYNVLFPRVVTYSERYHTIQKLTIPDSKLEGWGTFRLPEDERVRGNKNFLSPVFVDTLLHAAGFIANLQVASSEACICVAIGTLRISHVLFPTNDDFYIYSRLQEHKESGFFLAESYALRGDGTVVAAVEGMRFNRLNLVSFQNHLASSLDKGMTKKSVAIDTVHAPRLDVQAGVKEVIARVVELPLDSIEEVTRLEDIGVDSMMQIELRNAIQKRFALHAFDLDFLMDGKTVQDLQREVVLLLRQGNAEPRKLETLQTNNGWSGKDLTEIISELTGISRDKVIPEATLESLGIDSLLMLELQKVLTIRYGQRVVDEDLLDFDITVGQLRGLILSQTPPAEEVCIHEGYTEAQTISATEPTDDGGKNIHSTGFEDFHPVRIRLLGPGSSDQPPLFLLHDGSGMIDAYSKLGPIGSNVFGIASPNPRSEGRQHAASSLVQMARHYASAIAAFTADKIVLGGTFVRFYS
jgi:malonyl CoA-acyl carrier protein transacylase/acyl carrier protein